MRPLDWRRTGRIGVRVSFATAALWLVHCASIADDGERPVPDVPPADRESWNCLIELGGSGRKVSIRAPYLRDFVDRQETRADSGADMTLADSTGTVTTRLVASRLLVNHRDNHLIAGGAISLTSTDSLELHSDSLVWDRAANHMYVPGNLSLRTSGSDLSGSNLRAGEEFDYWTAESIRGTLSGTSAQGEPYEVRLRALRDSTHRDATGLVAHYDSVVAEVDEFHIRSTSARWVQSAAQVSFTGHVQATEHGAVSRSIDADELLYDIGGDRRVARGDVTLQEDDETRLRAPRLEEDGEGRWRAMGHSSSPGVAAVILDVGDRSFRAVELAYERESGTFLASAATYRRGDHTMRADSLVYRRESDRIEALGGIHLTLPAMGGSATGESTDFNLIAERAELAGTASEPARLSRPRSGADTLHIEADLMTFDLSADQLTGKGAFVVRAGNGLEVAGESGSFHSQSERLELTGSVRFLQRHSGDPSTESRLDTDSMTVQLDSGHIGKIDLPMRLDGLIRGGGGQTSWLSADGGSAHLDGERLSSVELHGAATVTHRSPAAAAVNRFSADAMTLSFDPGGALEGVRARGSAELTSRLPAAAEPATAANDSVDTAGASDDDGLSGGSINRVSGESLSIRLEDGRVVEVEVTESIEGRYLPDKEGGER